MSAFLFNFKTLPWSDPATNSPVAECFFSSLKNELVHHSDFHTREAARAAIFNYIEVFYNRRRRHQALGYISPAQFEEQRKFA